MSRTLKPVPLIAVLCLIMGATLLPRSGSPATPSFFCLTCDELWGVDVILNMILFAPLGVVLYWMGFSQARIAIACFGLSTAIEFLQWAVPGRDPSVRDIIANGLGGVMAGWIAREVVLLVRDGKPRQHARALALVLTIWWVQAIVTGWAFAPDAPTARPYYGQWAHLFPGTTQFEGKVLGAALNDLPVRDDSLPETELLRESIARTGISLQVSADSLPPTTGEAQILGLVVGPIRIIGLDMMPGALRFQSRGNSARLGLMRPGMLLPVTQQSQGEVVMRAVHLRDRLSLDVMSAGGDLIQSARWTLSAAQGWALIVPRRPPASQLPLWTLCWMVGFSLPAGLLAYRSGNSGSGGLRVLLVMAAMLLPLQLAAALLHCGVPTLTETLGVIAGCVAAIPVARLAPLQRSGTSATNRS